MSETDPNDFPKAYVLEIRGRSKEFWLKLRYYSGTKEDPE
jgi:hypothetical protein